MPLPLPNLDTRSWTDLVDEGRALIPQFAPTWTDHNVHDPGITLIELLAWLIEQGVYRANRIPEKHRRKFMALAGFPVEPPNPARVALAFTPAGADPVTLVDGLTVATMVRAGSQDVPSAQLRFRLTHGLTALPVTVKAVQSFDGRVYVDRTPQWSSALPFPAWGEDPIVPQSVGGDDPGPALYIGFDQVLPPDAELWLWVAISSPRAGADERARIVAEAGDLAATARLEHHSVHAVWEYFDGAAWRTLSVLDDTRALTLDGPVVVAGPATMQPQQRGLVGDSLVWIRYRMTAGRPDTAPTIASIAANAVSVEQATDARATFEILPGVAPPAGAEPAALQRQRLELGFDALGRITAVAVTGDETWPETLVLEYQAATSDASGRLACTLVQPGLASGRPFQTMTLPGSPIARGAVRLWSLDEDSATEWQPAADLDSASPTDLKFALDPATGRIQFGDGEHGRMPPRGAAIVAQYATTVGAMGNVAPNARWTLADADNAVNQTLLAGSSLDSLVADIAAIVNPLAARDGRVADLASTAGRAAETLWAHERLVELAAPDQTTLDQLDQSTVFNRRAPVRATTLLDFERLALDVPGTSLGRARAWAGIDPRYPCLRAPGTVTVTIVPTLPLGRPEPTPELLTLIRRYLLRRRTIGTRLVVVGPEYVEVRVRAVVRSAAQADRARTQADIVAALNQFLDPMRGGPSSRGWPFGRHVYRSEVLQVIDGVPGVDYVASMELVGNGSEALCGNLCVGMTALATPGTHEVEVL